MAEMSLLEFARGPALYGATVVFVVGVLWRLLGILLLPRKKDYSEPRESGWRPWLGGVRVVFSRMWPRRDFLWRTAYSQAMGYIFHIGLALVVFGGSFHILFIENVFGVSWPALPNGFIYFTGAVSVAVLAALLIRRILHPVLRMLSNFDDYFSWFVTTAPLVTGLMAVGHIGARYETLLALHILSFDLLLLWFPFGKLIHAFFFVPSRAITGYIFTRRGAST